VWWRRLARMDSVRLKVDALYALSERILDLDTQSGIRELVQEALKTIPGVTGVEILEERPSGHPPNAVSLPMTVRGAVSGWLVLSGPNLKLLREEESALQHLANQIAIAQALTEQRALQERLLLNERQGALGQLISSVAAELRPPLLRLRQAPGGGREAEEALNVLDRLLSFTRPEREPQSVVELGALIRGLLELRSEAMRLALVRLEPEIIESPLPVSCSRSQLEQAFLNVLVFAEQSLAAAQHRVIHLSATREDCSHLVRLRLGAPPDSAAEALLAVSRSVIEAHRGSWRMRCSAQETVLEIRLPAAAQPAAEPASKSVPRSLSLLAAVPDPALARQVAEAASACGHRFVPASGGGEALLAASRIPFDAILSVESLPDMEWREFAARARTLSPAFILLTTRGAPPPEALPFLRIPVEPDSLRLVLESAARPMPGGLV